MAYDEFPERPDESVGSWMLTLFVSGIPIIGVIYLLVLAFGSGSAPSKRNFRARRPHMDSHCPRCDGRLPILLLSGDRRRAQQRPLTSHLTSSSGAASESLGCRPALSRQPGALSFLHTPHHHTMGDRSQSRGVGLTFTRAHR